MPKPKSLYVGYLSTNVRMFIERCMAFSEKQAYVLFCNRIAKQSGVDVKYIFGYFGDHPDKCEIKKEVEFEEVAETENTFDKELSLKIDKVLIDIENS